ncbi:hypothetical protein [Sphingomonas sp. 1P08PE]|uniref:hypothetical protein n=1 Tax=Sphingomonas sp. 1P08PE TaxID=554122 RepID=UPI0039A2FABC
MTNVFMRCSLGRYRFVAAGSSVSTVDGIARSWYFCRRGWLENTIAIAASPIPIELFEALVERSRARIRTPGREPAMILGTAEEIVPLLGAASWSGLGQGRIGHDSNGYHRGTPGHIIQKYPAAGRFAPEATGISSAPRQPHQARFPLMVGGKRASKGE